MAHIARFGRKGFARRGIVVICAATLVIAGALLYANAKSIDREPAQTGPAVAKEEADGPPIRIYYFHRTIRCPSCEKIEAWAKKAVEQAFADELAAGQLAWKTFNIDDPQYVHFEEDYQLKAQSVILSEVRKGKEIRWKNLDKVWDLLDDEARFISYIQEEIKAFRQAI